MPFENFLPSVVCRIATVTLCGSRENQINVSLSSSGDVMPFNLTSNLRDNLNLQPLDLGEFKGITHSRLPDLKSFNKPSPSSQPVQPQTVYEPQPVYEPERQPQASYEEPVSYSVSFLYLRMLLLMLFLRLIFFW